MREENNFRRLASLFYKNFLYDNRFPYVGVANCKNPKLNLLFFFGKTWTFVYMYVEV